jgi:hypothetical protein
MWTDTQASFAENSPRTEYIRADLSAAREAAARREGWNAARKQAAKVIGRVRGPITMNDHGVEWEESPCKEDYQAAILAMKEIDE